MPKRVRIELADVVAWPDLHRAFWRAAKGSGDSGALRAFQADLDARLRALREAVLDGRAPEGQWQTFVIRDPKPRRIAAPCFTDRVLHHALMAQLGPVLDRVLIDHTYACREGRGTLAAVHHAQHAIRRWPWFVKADVRSYFASVDHAILRAEVLERRVKGRGVLALCDRILSTWPGPPAVGLPIGALTSQYFANSYLDAVDRPVCEQLGARAYVRYMDDLVWWCDSRADARRTYAAVRDFAWERRRLELKPPLIARSVQGVPFLGFRVLPGTFRLSRRRQRRYKAARRRWEARYTDGSVDAEGLQRGFASALAITRHADAAAWRREQLRRSPAVDA